MSNTHTGENVDPTANGASDTIEVPGTPEMTVADMGNGNLEVLGASQAPPKRVPKPTKIDLPPSQAQDGTNGADRPPTPNYTCVEDPEGHLNPIFEGAGPGYEPEPKLHKEARADGKIELSGKMAPKTVGFGWPTWKKWMILCVVFMVQVSMNFNTSVYPNAVALIPDDERFSGVSGQGARVGQMIFLVAYAFGSEVRCSDVANECTNTSSCGRLGVKSLAVGLLCSSHCSSSTARKCGQDLRPTLRT